MKITQKWVDKYQPCSEAIRWWDKESDSFKILDNLIADKKLDWANWFIVRLMNHKQKIRYAIYSAKQVLEIYEKKYPDDKRPRQAVEAAKNYLKNPSKKNKDAAYAAANAAYAAAYAASAAADAAAYAASAAADAAAYAASAAAYAASAAADAAAYAASAAAYAADEVMKKKILQYGIKILKEE